MPNKTASILPDAPDTRPSELARVRAEDARAKTEVQVVEQRKRQKAPLAFVAVAVLLGGGIGSGAWSRESEANAQQTKEHTLPQLARAEEPANVAFPRRVLFISITKYMYLNPLTQSQPGAPDRVRGAAFGLAFQWRVPMDKENNQVFVLSDTITGNDERLPMKNVVEGAYQEFCKTSRSQDRILIYFGGHAIEKDGKAYIAPMEAELNGADWEKTLIPLSHFYDEVKKCKATQKVVIWDVCRFNPERGKVRPGSEPMSEALHKALTTPPAGIQTIVTCKPGENALEFSMLRPDGFAGPALHGSIFLESVRFVSNPKNGGVPKIAPVASDPLPVDDWTKATAKRTAEIAELGAKVERGVGKQTITLVGAAPEKLTAPNPEEKAATRFEFPRPPKGVARSEIKSLTSEFDLPPIKPGLADIELADFPFAAEVLKDYAADVKLADILKDKEKYKLRIAVLDSLDMLRRKWATGAVATKIRTAVLSPINDALKLEVKKEQEFWAISIVELELELLKLEGLAADRKDEPSKRWQAHYDFAFASLKARLAYLNEYNKLLGYLITATVPPLDPKLGQDGYVLVASEKLKSGKDVKKLAEEAQAQFQEIAVKYTGTPWALQAKREKGIALGLNWKPASLKGE